MFEEKLEKLIELNNEYLLSKNSFIKKLNNILKEDFSPVESFLFIINNEEPLETVLIGDISLQETNTYNHKTEIWDDISNTSITSIQMLIKNKDGERYNSYDIFEKIFKSYWREQSPRLAKSLLLPDGDGDMPKMLDLTIKKAIEDNKKCAILYADIDKFGDINNTYNHETGDALISKIAIAIEKYTGDSIPIHSHGDEFAIVHSSKYIEEVLLITNNIRNAIKNISVKHTDSITEITEEINLDISLSFGIYIIDKNNYNPSLKYADYLSKAEEALVPSDGSGKQRGKVRIYSDTLDEVSGVSLNSVKRSLIQSKVNLLSHRPYSNIWLNFISRYVRDIEDLSIDNIEEYFTKIIDIVAPNFTSDNISNISNSSINFTHSLSIVDIIISFLNGLVVSDVFTTELQSIKIKYDVDNHRIKLFLNSDQILNYSHQANTLLENFSEIQIPAFPNFVGSKTYMDGKISNSLLVIIGNEYNKRLDDIFNTVVNVDNRPMTGGGLPDFWEAAIANLINSISNNKNIKYVFVLGDNLKTTKISKLLENVNNKSVPDMHIIAYKTGYDSSTVDSIFNTLEGDIIFLPGEEELINILFDKEFSEGNIFDISNIDYSHTKQKKGYLKQEVNLAEFRLDRYDGCRGESLRKIYPVVINNIREIDLHTNTDFSNKTFKELTDYKIILTKPLEESIPWFYENDKQSFDDYYEDNFLKEDGTFYNKLNANDQVEIVTNHIVDHLKKSNNKNIINTRRAIIILDNEINEGKLEPVGLVSVRIYYDLSTDGSININFTYIWRTVEVIVGLPYSMYGSICYSDFLLKKVIEKLGHEENLAINIKNIKLGNLTYIAQSLHMFRDSYSENIAKNIVDEATI